MIRRPPHTTLSSTLFPFSARFRAASASSAGASRGMTRRSARRIVFDPAVAQADFARGMGGDVAVVGHQHHGLAALVHFVDQAQHVRRALRSEEHTSELQSLMRISYAVFCLKKKKRQVETQTQTNST